MTGSGSDYTGIVTQATSFNQCTHPVGQRIWTLHGSGGSYSGTHIGVDFANCGELPMAATWNLTDNEDGTYSLRLCADAGCATLHRAADTSPPEITLQVPDRPIRAGKEFKVRWSVSDDSGEAQLNIALYSNGTVVEGFSEASKGLVNATGKLMQGTVGAVSGWPGPFYLCMWAEDAAGNRSDNAPYSACGWVAIEVLLRQLPATANGCGGAQWGEWAAMVQNWLLDSQEYHGWKVEFRTACNQHDAGYAGITVKDPFRNGGIIDFREWTRSEVDSKFKDDLAALCRKWLKPAHLTAAQMDQCEEGPQLALVPGATPGAATYFEGVRAYARAAFDTNPTLQGVQTDNMPQTNPPGAGRDNY
ncbi:MAG: hypothetical protein Q7V58_05280 [Actinomycetota bacterium]|nr:hypothetical protein [Actinomycetota bacterium]